MSVALTLIGERYQVHEQIGAGAMGSVYRCFDRLTEQTVALKSVKLERAAGRGDARRVAITREFETLASLHHPRIIEVLDYGFDADDKPFFTMTYLENAQHLDDAARALPLNERIHLIIQMLEALEYLHRREIIHHDLKPSNVLVDREGGVKVLDFGVALLSQRQNKDTTSGTLGYAAPEFLQGARPSIASDLYAVGILTYEVAVGHHPFDIDNLRHLLYQIANELPDFSALDNPALITVISTLLAKTPAERYPNARAAIRALYQALREPIPGEPTAIRESFLQAAQFVGREAEFGVLKEALTRAGAGEGSAWLIGGESGVGKSRLLDELRTQALVEGALVLRGQGIAEGGLPFQLWRDAVRRLSLQTDLTDLAASILKPLVPDIGRLLGRDVRDLPPVDAQSLQLRLLSVIEAMFREQEQLIVVLLEDLQWAVDSLILLRRLAELASESHLLIIGSYRDDERPSLPDELPALHHLKLERLAPASIEELSASMLGDVGKAPGLIDLLTRETEGNVFFIVEVMRALAEDAGQLADIGQKSLPEHVFAGGMQTVIQRRLDTVPEAARPLMMSAAVGGRELDLPVLRALMPSINLADWLQQVATVIEMRDNHYRFAHDKLREAILTSLPTEQRRQTHRQVALAIESAYPESPEQYAALAYHWGHAEDAAKTILYASRAGQEALRSGSFREAMQFFEQAVTLGHQVHLNTLELANLHYLLGHTYWGQTNSLKTYEAHGQALHLLGIDVPQTSRGLLLGMLWPLANHLRRRMIGIHRPHAHNETALLAAKALNEITIASYHDANFALGLYSIANGMNRVEQAGSSAEALGLRVHFYSDIGFAFGDMGLQSLARSYFALAEKYLQRESDPETAAAFDYIYGGYLAAQGQWERCNQVMAESLQIAQGLGSWIHWIEAIGFQVPILMLQGRFTESLATAEGAILTATRNGQTQARGMLITAKARLLLMQGKTEAAKAQYFTNEATIEAAKQLGGQLNGRIAAQGFLTELYTRSEDWDAALKSAEALNALIRDAQTVSISFMLAADACASVLLYLTLWEQRGDASYGPFALAMLDLYHRKYTRQVAIGHPIEDLYRCWHAWLNNDENQARKLGAQAIQAAQTYRMPYFEALARYHFARFLPQADPDRAAHMQAALTLFRQIGADYHANLIQQSE
ncbi:MAG TPA: protein kinase [Phototrophicaceae bacterium]|nr:protein kinase [Phototrophicaceae bacterium]